ncbi:hypothetical protein DVH24_018643 [Malus domestica]|uniref:Uncharacterized protein n=1 Tax=Malus domestica TaxID=3750 RepID=A0A498HIF7_MALDO|nr:hypothetical protein DVH24_018643 [Malus domestica]
MGKAWVCEMGASFSRSTTGQVIAQIEEVATLKGQLAAQQVAQEAEAAAWEAREAEIIVQFSTQDEKIGMILLALQMSGLQILMLALDLALPSTSQPLRLVDTQ